MKNLVCYSVAFFLVFLAHSNPTFAKSVEHNLGFDMSDFEMSDKKNRIEKIFLLKCKILDQVILQAEDGKAKRYSSYENSTKINDSVEIDFILLHTKSDYVFTIGGVSVTPDNHSSRLIWKDKNNDIMMMMDKDYFSIRTTNHTYSGYRYFKDDWSVTRIYPQHEMIQALNCMGMPLAYEESVDIISKFHNQDEE
jgi:hypothetical protein